MILFASFGWAKPVPVDAFNFRHPRRDTALVAFAGPVANLLGAGIAALALRLILLIPQQLPIVLDSFVTFAATLFMMFVILNVNLAIFNLIPIHPFDGFSVVAGLLPERESRQWMSLQSLGIIMIILFVFPVFGGSSPVLRFISPIVTTLTRVLLP
jgi:Zn-dependent protease